MFYILYLLLIINLLNNNHSYAYLKVSISTNGFGPVENQTLENIKKLDAGFKHSKDGVNFPYRGKNYKIPTLEEAIIELKNIKNKNQFYYNYQINIKNILKII